MDGASELLFGVRAELGVDRSQLKDILRSLAPSFSLDKVSSLYVGDHEVRGFKNLLKCVSFCVMARIRSSEDRDLKEILKDLRSSVQFSSSHPHWREVLILNWNHQIQIDPEMILPHPEWHKKTYWLLPSVELAGDTLHPILQKPLRAILAERPESTQAEGVKFFDRARGLLDF